MGNCVECFAYIVAPKTKCVGGFLTVLANQEIESSKTNLSLKKGLFWEFLPEAHKLVFLRSCWWGRPHDRTGRKLHFCTASWHYPEKCRGKRASGEDAALPFFRSGFPTKTDLKVSSRRLLRLSALLWVLGQDPDGVKLVERDCGFMAKENW